MEHVALRSPACFSVATRCGEAVIAAGGTRLLVSADVTRRAALSRDSRMIPFEMAALQKARHQAWLLQMERAQVLMRASQYCRITHRGAPQRILQGWT